MLASYTSFHKTSAPHQKDASWTDQSALVYSVVLILVHLKVLVELDQFYALGKLVLMLNVALYIVLVTVLSKSWGVEELLDLDQRSIFSYEA